MNSSFEETLKGTLEREKIQYSLDPLKELRLDGTSSEMLKQFYDAVDKSIYDMATKWTEEHGWGITLGDFRFFIFLHANGSCFLKQYVEDILEDCNFHTINELIHAKKYLDAYDMFKEDFDFSGSEADAQ